MRFLLVSSLLLLLLPNPAFAHGVYIFGWKEADRLCAESYFSGSDRVRGGKIEVRGADGALLVQGVTDDAGRWCGEKPKTAGPLHFVVLAGEGHRGEFVLEPSEPDAAPSDGAAPASGASSSGSASTVPPSGSEGVSAASPVGSSPAPAPAQEAASVGGSAAAALSEDAVRRIVREELSPAMQRLAAVQEAQTSPKLKDIVGGLGWLAGLCGLYAFWASRRKK